MPNTIDERVVVLRFDNSQFESATETSMNTLQRLKQSLKMDGAADGMSKLSKATKTFSIGVEGNVFNAIESLSKRFSTLGVVGMSVINKLTTTAMGFAKKIVTAIPSQIIQGGWQRALNIENARFQIEGLKKDWTALSDDINYAVEDTAYGFDQAALAASMLSASGIEAGENMKKALRGISGVAAMANTDYTTIADVFTTVAGRGSLMTEQLRQFEHRGLNIAATIKDYFNGVNDGSIEATESVKNSIEDLTNGFEVTEQNIRDFVSDSVIDFELFAEAMDTSFGEHAKDANKTFTGAFSNMKFALKKIGADVAETQLFNLMNVFNAIRPAINGVRWALQPLIKLFNEFSLKAADKVVNGFNKISTALGIDPKTGKAVSGIAVAGKEIHDKWAEHLEKIAHGTKETEDGVASSADSMATAVEKLGHACDANGKVIRVTAEEAQAAWDIWNKGTYGNQPEREKNLAKVGLEYKYVQAYVNDLIAAEFDLSKTTIAVADASEKASNSANDQAKSTKDQTKATEKQTKAVHKTERAYANFADVVRELTKAFKPGQKILKSVSNVFAGLANIFRVVGRVLHPIAVAFTQWLIPGLGKAAGKVETLTGKFKAWTEKLQITTEQQNKIYEVSRKVFMVLDNIARVVKTIFKAGFNVIKRIAKSVGSVLLPIFKALGKAIKTITERVKKFGEEHQLLTKIIEKSSNAFNKIAEFVEKAAEKIRKFLTENERVQKAGEAFKKLFEKIWEFLKEFFAGVKNFFEEAKKSEGLQKLRDALERLWEVVKELSGDLLDRLTSKLSELTGASFMSPSFENAVNLFSNFAGGLSKVTDGITNFLTNIKDGKNPLKEFFSSFKETKSFSLFSSLFKNSGDTIEKLKSKFGGSISSDNTSASLLGLKDVISPLSDISVDPAELKNKFGKVLEWIQSVDWKDVADTIADWGLVLAKIKTALSFSKLATSFAGMLDSFSGLGKSISGFLDNYIKLQKKKIKIEMFKTIAVGILLIVAALFILSKIKTEDLPRSIGILAGVVGGLIALMTVLGHAEKMDVKALAKMGTTMVTLGAGMILIAAAIAILSRMDVDHILKASAIIGGFVVGMVFASRYAGKADTKGMAQLGACMLLLSVAMLILGQMKVKNLIKAGATIVGLILVLAFANKLAEKSFRRFDGIVKMALAIDLIVAAIVVMALIPVKRAIFASAALGTIIFGLVIACRYAKNVKGGIKNLKELAGVVAVIATAIAVLAVFKPGKLIQSVAALTAVILDVMLLCKSVEKEKPLKGAVAIAIIMGSITGAFAVLAQMDTAGMLVATLGLSAVMLAMMGLMKSISKVGALGPQGLVTGIVAMEAVLWSIVGVLALLSTINEKAKGNGKEGIGKTIGVFLGDLIGGIIQGVGEAGLELLKSVASTLEEISPQLQPFFDMLSGMPEGLGENAKNLAVAILALTGASLIDGITSFVTLFQGGLGGLGRHLVSFGTAMVDFYQSVSSIDDWGRFSQASKALKQIADIGGHLDFGDPGQISRMLAAMPNMGQDMVTFYKKLEGTEIDVAKAKAFKQAVAHLSVIGEKVEFGDPIQISNMLAKLPSMGQNMASFYANLEGTTIDVSLASSFKQAVSHLVGIGDAVSVGDPMQIFNMLAIVPRMGRNLAKFYENIAGVTIDVSQTKAFSKAVNNLASLGSTARTSDPSEIMALCRKLPTMGSNFATYCKNVAGVDFSDGVSAAKALAKISNELANVDTSAIDTVSASSSNFKNLGSRIKSLFSNLSGTDTSSTSAITSALNNIGKSASSVNTSSFKSVGTKVVSALASGIKSSSAAKTAMSSAIKSMVSSLNSKIASFKAAGRRMITMLASGVSSGASLLRSAGMAASRNFANAVRSGSSSARAAGRALASSAASGAKGSSLYSAGQDLVSGFIRGIKSSSYYAKLAAAAMARAAKKAAENVLGIASPSKEFSKIGAYVVKGFANGISNNMRMSDKASGQMADNTIKTVKNTVSTISALANADLDVQPTITPVIDMSNVSAGANRINNLLASRQSLGFTASVSGNIAEQLQNRNNTDSALSKLSDRIDSMTDTMNSRQMINYITVDGAENPEAFADRFVRKLKLNMRTV